MMCIQNRLTIKVLCFIKYTEQTNLIHMSKLILCSISSIPITVSDWVSMNVPPSQICSMFSINTVKKVKS